MMREGQKVSSIIKNKLFLALCFGKYSQRESMGNAFCSYKHAEG